MTVEFIPTNLYDGNRLITCDTCDIQYSYDHYKILADLNKLAFFYAEVIGVSCHSCLLLYGRILVQNSGKECYQIEVIGENFDHILNFPKNA